MNAHKNISTALDKPFIWLHFQTANSHCEELFFTDFIEIIVAYKPEAIRDAMLRVEAAISKRYYVVGYLAYEAASGLDSAMQTPGKNESSPLLWFGVAKQSQPVDEDLVNGIFYPWKTQADTPQNRSTATPSSTTKYHLSQIIPLVDQNNYHQLFQQLKEHIRHGDIYQINYTFPLTFEFAGKVRNFYQDLRNAQQSAYCAWIHQDNQNILSLSPELFFALHDDLLTVKPMKGSRPRGLNVREDLQLCKDLETNPKDRAENVMIVDLMRNDLGKIAINGGVKVKALYETAIYPTIIQMTSTVQARLQYRTTMTDIMTALFPPGSVTGTPKIKAMELIARYETLCRGNYCGCIGMIKPGGDAYFNVAIRTLTLDHQGRGIYPVGSAVVAGSEQENEYVECLTKAEILTKIKQPQFQLVETMLYLPTQNYQLIDLHLIRLKASADYFNFPCPLQTIVNRLQEVARDWICPMKIRLLLNRSGKFAIEARIITKQRRKRPIQIALADSPISTGNIFLYHKTTNRQVYEQAKASASGVDDIILYNERGEITESTIANVAINIDNHWYTPPAKCGLLPGTMRQKLLNEGKIKERIITCKEFRTANQIKLFNSVRGEYHVAFIQ